MLTQSLPRLKHVYIFHYYYVYTYACECTYVHVQVHVYVRNCCVESEVDAAAAAIVVTTINTPSGAPRVFHGAIDGVLGLPGNAGDVRHVTCLVPVIGVPEEE